MKFELKMDKEQLITIGKGAVKIGKTIVIEGTKTVALNSVAAVITQSFDDGIGGVKKLDLDDVLAGGKKRNKARKEKKGLFSKKKKEETEVSELDVEVSAESVTINADDVEIIDPK